MERLKHARAMVALKEEEDAMILSRKANPNPNPNVPGPKAKEEVLSGASDWKVQFDIDVTDGASLGYRTKPAFPTRDCSGQWEGLST